MTDYNSGAAKYNRDERIKAQGRAEGLENFVFGKVQPQAIELEEAVLGALMLDNEAFDIVNDTVGLRVESFYTEAHQMIYKAISALNKGLKPIDLLTVTEELRKMDAIEIIGGSYHLVELTNRVGSAANIEYHAFCLLEKEMKRKMLANAAEITRMCYDDTSDAFDIMQNAARLHSEIEDIPTRSVRLGNLDAAAEKLRRMVILAQQGGLLGNSCQISSIDRIFNGSRKGRLDVAAARPGVGKTAYMIAKALNYAKQGIPVVIGSIELTDVELLGRLASSESNIENDKLEGKEPLSAEEHKHWNDCLSYITTLPIFINDSSTQSVRSLRAFLRKVMKQLESDPTNRYAKFLSKMEVESIELMVDYIQIMTPDEDETKNELRERQVSKMARGLKAIAKDYKVHVDALAQLNRAVETRGGSKIPSLSDIRESGSIEQEADSVSFLHRPEYYGITEDEEGNTLRGKLELIIAKPKGGAVGSVMLEFDGPTNKISDVAGTITNSNETPF